MSYLYYLLLITFLSCSTIDDEKYKLETLDGRTYVLDLPSHFDSARTYNLLFAFHGARGNGKGMREISRFNNYSNKYIVVYPDALVENWEEGCRCNKPFRLGVDDIGFIRKLVNNLKKNYSIKNVYGVGYSQGGLFAHNVADKLSDIFSGVAIVAASMSATLSSELFPKRDISILMIHGMIDGVLPYFGQDAGLFSLVSSPDAFKRWSSVNNCDTAIQITENSIYYQQKTQNESGATVRLDGIKNGGHTWDFRGYETSKEIILFFDDL